MKIYIARHGQTEWNRLNKICGLTDDELTELGREQAEMLAESLKDKNISVIIASPLKRARITAGYVSEKINIPIITDDRLIEQNYGVFEGTNRKGADFLANKRNFAYRYPQGESMMQVAHRTYGLLDEIREKYAGKDVLLVCHGGVARVMRTYFLDMTNDEFFNYSMENATFETFEMKED
jgi:probable phosphoglycerate mutase